MNKMKFFIGALPFLIAFSALAAADDKTLAVYQKGEASFTQGGKTGTVPLFAQRPVGKNSLRETPTGRNLGLMFTASGKPASLELVIMLKDNAAKVTLLTLRDGPAGTSYFAYTRSKCTATIAKADADGAEGTVSCAGAFDGPAVSKLSFRVTP